MRILPGTFGHFSYVSSPDSKAACFILTEIVGHPQTPKKVLNFMFLQE